MLVTFHPPLVRPLVARPAAVPVPAEPARPVRRLECADPDDEEEDLGDLFDIDRIIASLEGKTPLQTSHSNFKLKTSSLT